jgi:hypothetical protein
VSNWQKQSMNSKAKGKGSLWLDSTRSYYFIIPNDQELSSGDFIIFTLSGDEKKLITMR